jgi:hypothetical protein
LRSENVQIVAVPVTTRAVLFTAFGFDVLAVGNRLLLPTVREPSGSCGDAGLGIVPEAKVKRFSWLQVW